MNVIKLDKTKTLMVYYCVIKNYVNINLYMEQVNCKKSKWHLLFRIICISIYFNA